MRDELVERAHAARDNVVRARSEASRAYARAVAEVVEDEAFHRGRYGAQARAARRMDLTPARVGDILKDLDPTVDSPTV